MLIKRLASYVLIAVVLFITFYFLHGYVVQKVGAIHPFSLFEVYVFNFLFSIITVVIFDLLATYTIRFKDQLGFLYLATMIAKIGLFCIVFKESLFAGVPLTKGDSLSLLIPIFLYLFYEVYILAKILNRKPSI
ncbi:MULTISPECIES: DUF6168 family protein [unclassified Leeuwenhoekiella]|uniref:DUF6168 family protein n=1 Tax=unclassified Leeuwenhoekiella TaxID=2615029 RepID=UPI000C4C1AD4|nr:MULTISPECIES: DUF6168 family protein [unclassified Leeuwenhoekiella]MAW96031.1 hypothetical protein [Leeuwenhoekiella sp.]MBA80025.1 hypothetical protein [Leeuwenhoekiella sp.]|tara:strand:+ start:27167 stop:27568 length:402 start_codon:yes stop_codon:yes gene_type:complete